MRKRYLTTFMTLLCAASLAFGGCGSSENTAYTDLMQYREVLEDSNPSTDPGDVQTDHTIAADCMVGEEFIKPEDAFTDFGVRLFQNGLAEGENTLLSPVSVLFALSMTANGAVGDTLAQMEEVLGMPLDQLNTGLYLYRNMLPESDTYHLKAANSIWFKDDPGLAVNDTFLQTNAEYYDAGIYKIPFDNTALQSINGWVAEKTEGMIPTILNEIPADAVMYLINALAFDAQWETAYKQRDIKKRTFTLEDGATREVELMYSEEKVYLEDDMATGFVKYYDDKAYAFAALLPNQGISVADYVASLTGEHLQEMLTSPEDVTVNAATPKFTCEYSTELSPLLSQMGMTDAFRGDVADFSALGNSANGNLYIGRVLHKTFLALDDKGTKAGAATAVEVKEECAAIEEPDIRTVTLDRPFVYLLIDCETMIPVFMGTLMDPVS